MSATSVSGAITTDWTLTQDSNVYLGDLAPSMLAILNEVKALWLAKVSTGTPPDDILNGWILGQGSTKNVWRTFVTGGNYLLQFNTGSESSPTWTTILSVTSAGVVTGIDHGGLSGLSDDDHTQYLLANGSRALAGNWSAGGNNISSIGTAAGTTASFTTGTFSSSLTVSGLPVSTTTDHGAMSGLGDNDHPQYLLRDGSAAMTGNLNLGGNDLTNVDDITADDITVDVITAATGNYSTSLTVSGLPVITDVDLFTAVASGTQVYYFGNATSVTASHSLNSDDVLIQCYEGTSEPWNLIQPNITRIVDNNTVFVEFASPRTGKVEIVALTQRVLGAGNLSYEHVQGSSATTWTVEHNLSTLQPLVAVWDSSSPAKIVIPDEIEATDADTVTITFNSALAGRATVTKVGSAVSLGGGGGGGGGVTDHGALTGLSDDDHSQYILAAGTRAFSGNQSFGGNNITNVASGTITNLGGTHATFTNGYFGTSLTIGGVAVSTVTAHSQLSGLTTGDPHTQYLLADGTRALSGAWSLGGNNLTTGGTISGTQLRSSGAVTGQSGDFANGLTVSGTPVNIGKPNVGLNALIKDPSNYTYKILQYSPSAFFLDSIVAQTTSGTCTVNVRKEGSSVTGLSAVSVTTSESTTNSSGNNVVQVGDTLDVVVSSVSSTANGLSLTLVGRKNSL